MFARVSVQPRSELMKQTLNYKGGSEPGLGIEYQYVQQPTAVVQVIVEVPSKERQSQASWPPGGNTQCKAGVVE